MGGGGDAGSLALTHFCLKDLWSVPVSAILVYPPDVLRISLVFSFDSPSHPTPCGVFPLADLDVCICSLLIFLGDKSTLFLSMHTWHCYCLLFLKMLEPILHVGMLYLALLREEGLGPGPT